MGFGLRALLIRCDLGGRTRCDLGLRALGFRVYCPIASFDCLKVCV